MRRDERSLLDAVRCRDIVTVVKMCPAEWGSRDAHGQTALHLAVKTSFFLAIRTLKVYEARLRLPNGRTALMEAVTRRSIKSILLLRRCEKQCQDNNGKTALMLAAGMGYYEAVRLLGPLESGFHDIYGLTALMHATLADSAPCVKFLLKYEAKQVDFQGRSALIYAVLYGCHTVISLLIKSEAGLQDNKGNTAFIYACRLNSVFMASQLYSLEKDIMNKKRQTGLINAAMTHSIDVVSLIVSREKRYFYFSDHGTNIKKEEHVAYGTELSNSNNSSLFKSFLKGAVNKFMKIGSSFVFGLLQLREGYTWFRLSFVDFMQAISDSLLRCFPTTASIFLTALHTYIYYMPHKFGRLFALLRKDAKLLLTDSIDIPLGMEMGPFVRYSRDSCRMTRLENAVGLVQNASQLRKQDSLGYTALMYACKVKNFHITKILAPYETGIQSLTGECALMILLHNTEEILPILIETEAHLYDEDMRRPCEIAFEAGNIAVGKILVNQTIRAHMEDISYRNILQRSFLEIENGFEALLKGISAIDECVDDILLLKEVLYDAVFDSVESPEKGLSEAFNILDSISNEAQCSICYNDFASVAVLPCAHLIMCTNCSHKLAKCPLCMTLIKNYLPIFE